MTNTIRAAALQIVSIDDVEQNLLNAEALIKEAADQGADLAVLPENFSFMSGDDTAKLNHMEQFGRGPIQSFLADNANKNNLWLVGGSIPLESGQPDHVYNSCLLFDPNGICVARYDKIHLFDVSVSHKDNEVYRESNTIAAGEEVVVADTPLARLGLSICYDLRFPELYRKLTEKGATILTIPSAFTETTGKQHWEVLLRARAIENLCFVIAPDQGGQNFKKRSTWGHSMIISPWGDILSSVEQGPGVICADLDLDRQKALRESFPALEHKRL